ncbi:hypothetical protein V6N11_017058 [Hibiscus sabdariffa]|uniref:Reverse transcriptase zinc-binding domain-containing protein n=1 Tax=Hibiscus sabdariffa TaxID=183260 RepID=A0ABR2TXJ1_9ROSI
MKSGNRNIKIGALLKGTENVLKAWSGGSSNKVGVNTSSIEKQIADLELQIQSGSALAGSVDTLKKVWNWPIPLRRPLFDWEKLQWNNLMECLNNFKPSNVEHDWVRWFGSSDGSFSVKLLRLLIGPNRSSESMWNEYVWIGFAPPKMEIFVWLLGISTVLPRDLKLFFEAWGALGDPNHKECFIWLLGTSQVPDCFLSLDCLMIDFSLVMSPKHSSRCPAPTPRWVPPPIGFLKLNIDGAVSSCLKGGIGGLLRDEKGSILFQFSEAFNNNPPAWWNLRLFITDYCCSYLLRGPISQG